MRTLRPTRSLRPPTPRSPHGSASPSSPTTPPSSRSAARTSADLRWPGGVECPRCSESTRLLWLDSRSKWHCYACRYQFSVTAGTLFHSSHLPVWKWFVAVHLMLERRTASRPTSCAGHSAAATRPPGSQPTGSAPRCAGTAPSCCAASSRPSSGPERRRPRARRPARGAPRPQGWSAAAPPAQRQVPPRLHRRAALALLTTAGTRTSSRTPSRPSSKERGSRMSGSLLPRSAVVPSAPSAAVALRGRRSSGSGSPTGPGASRR